MKNKTLTLPAIIIAIGLVVALVGCLLTSMQFKPAVAEQDFNYSVTYKIDGETKTFSGVYTCRFTGFGGAGVDPLARYYNGVYTVPVRIGSIRRISAYRRSLCFRLLRLLR
jgi:hypothetical protein